MSDITNPFAESAKFPFKRLQSAISALMDAPQKYHVSMPIKIDTADLQKSIKRQNTLEGYIAHRSDYADVPKWQKELDNLKPLNVQALEDKKAEIQTQANGFFVDMAEYGYNIDHKYVTRLTVIGADIYSPKNLYASLGFVSDTLDDIISEKYEVHKGSPKFDTLTPDQRRVLTLGLSVFVKQLGAVLSRCDDNSHEPDYISEIHESNRWPGPLGYIENTPTDFRKKGARDGANKEANDGFKEFAKLGIFKNLPLVRAILIADIFWNNNKDTVPFLETLDFIVKSGFVKPEFSGEQCFEYTLFSMYNDAQPHATAADKHECETRIFFQIEGFVDIRDKNNTAQHDARKFKEEMKLTADYPDFADEHAKREKEYEGIEGKSKTSAIIYDNWRNQIAPQLAEARMAIIRKKILDVITTNQMDIDIESDVEITLGELSYEGNYAVSIKIHATEDELTVFSENGIKIHNTNTPARTDEFNQDKFISAVNKPKKLNGDKSVVGVTPAMHHYLSKKPSLKNLVKASLKPKP